MSEATGLTTVASLAVASYCASLSSLPGDETNDVEERESAQEEIQARCALQGAVGNAGSGSQDKGVTALYLKPTRPSLPRPDSRRRPAHRRARRGDRLPGRHPPL